MVYVFRIHSPATTGTRESDLHGEEFDIQAVTIEDAMVRAAARLADIFSLASPARKAVTSIRLVGEYPSRSARERAFQAETQ